MLARSLAFALPPSRIASVLAANLFSTLACQSPPPRSPPRSPLSAPPLRLSLPASFAHLLHACSSLARWLPCSLPPRSLPRSVLDRFFYACSLASALARSTFAPLLPSSLHACFLARSPPPRSSTPRSLACLLPHSPHVRSLAGFPAPSLQDRFRAGRKLCSTLACHSPLLTVTPPPPNFPTLASAWNRAPDSGYHSPTASVWSDRL